MPRETLACLLAFDVPVRCVLGNGEREVLGAVRGSETGAVPEPFRGAVRWVAQALQPDYEAVLAGWPATLRAGVAGLGEVLVCHATPRSDTEIFTRRRPRPASGRSSPGSASPWSCAGTPTCRSTGRSGRSAW